jgi:hypothetical protein
MNVSTKFRVDYIAQALEYIEESRRELVREKPCIEVIDMKLGWALHRLRVALDIRPSDTAVEQSVQGMAERHARVISGPSTSSEQRELNALCRGLRSAP